MKTKPILFSGAMVRALLAGTKTQTRRLLRTSPHVKGEPERAHAGCGGGWHFTRPGGCEWHVDCPYGVPGDRLWVRESIELHHVDPETERAIVFYVADGAPCFAIDTWCWQRARLPSIHMPFGVRRITLEVTDVRVERLMDISEDDARAEGVEPDFGNAHTCASRDYRRTFERLWHEINGKRAPWESNPWVWVVSFKRVDARAEVA